MHFRSVFLTLFLAIFILHAAPSSADTGRGAIPKVDDALLDMTGDNQLDRADIDVLASVIAKKAECPAKKSCDVNRDSVVDARDIVSYWFVNPPYDYNHDSAVTRADTAILADVIVGRAECPESASCDVNKDGIVDVFDITA